MHVAYQSIAIHHQIEKYAEAILASSRLSIFDIDSSSFAELAVLTRDSRRGHRKVGGMCRFIGALCVASYDKKANLKDIGRFDVRGDADGQTLSLRASSKPTKVYGSGGTICAIASRLSLALKKSRCR